MNTSLALPAAMLHWLEQADRQVVTAVDSHTAGNPTRIVLSGITLPAGVNTVDGTRGWLRDNADHWRRRLVHEPRGGGLTCAVLPVWSREEGCDIGAVFLEPGSYPPMCGHCMIGFASVIVELNMLPELRPEPDNSLVFRVRTPAGPVGVTARRENGALTTVTLTNVESYTVRKDAFTLEGKAVAVELLYGGDYYISLDADQIDLSLHRDNASEIVRVARLLRESYVEDGVHDPLNDRLLDVYQVLFYQYDPTQPDEAKIVVVAPPGVIDRSPCGTGSSAFYAKLVTEGLLTPQQVLTTTSIIGSQFTLTTHQLRSEAERLYITPALTGRARINGYLLIAADADDELADGFAPL